MASVLPTAIATANAPDNRVRVGIVASISPLTVSIQGTLVPMGRAKGFFPVVGQPVSVIRQDGSWMAMDQPQSSADPSPQAQAGFVTMSVAAAASATTAVLFARAFTSVPAIAPNMVSGAAALANWSSRAINVATTGFTMFIYGPASTFTVDVYWQAQAVTQ
jgi:hypothetical protein